jgi:hypothetical protein
VRVVRSVHLGPSVMVVTPRAPSGSYVSRMLGHADIGLTVNTYGSWLNPSRPGALDVLDRVVEPVMGALS